MRAPIAVVYPVSREAARRGRSPINWVALLRIGGAPPRRADWSGQGKLANFLPQFAGWKFGLIDLPALFRMTERILGYPVVDRDPLDRWSFGRVTLLGDAAHPMCPNGSNGAAQGILDAEAPAVALGGAGGEVVTALARYEEDRRLATAAVVLSNRQFGPERVLQLVGAHSRACGRYRRRRHREEIEAITRRYRREAGFDVATLNQKSFQPREREEHAARPASVSRTVAETSAATTGNLPISAVTIFPDFRNRPEALLSYVYDVRKSSEDGSKSSARDLLEVQIMSKLQRVNDHRRLTALLTRLVRLGYETVILPIGRRTRRRRGARELARLDDHLLRDIGLTRAEVLAAAFGPVGSSGQSTGPMRGGTFLVHQGKSCSFRQHVQPHW